MGPIEKQCYQLQRLLSSEEKRVWSAGLMMLFVLWRLWQRQRRLPPLAVSHWAHWFPSTSGTPGLNHSLHMLTFLKDQPGHPLGADRWQPARAAAINKAPSEKNPRPPNALVYPTPGPPNAYDSGSRWKCRGGAVYCPPGESRDGCNETEQARTATRLRRQQPYESDQAEFEKRKACGACYHCPTKGPGKVNYAIFHTQCPTHGRSSTLEDRRDPTKRVVGSGSTF
jgi:hypothetical protein